MLHRFLGSLAAVLIGTGLALAESCPACCNPVPTVPIPPVQLWIQHPSETVHAPPVPIPGPVLFHKEIAPPTYTECPPSPPLRLFRHQPPPVTVFSKVPPTVELLRKEPLPPEGPHPLPPKPPIPVFHKIPEPPTCGPTIVAPSVTIFHKPAPPCPVECAPR
jgi:hypothetical protein